jgi:hypothetical protein
MNKALKLGQVIGLKPAILYSELLDYAQRTGNEGWFELEYEDIKHLLVTPYLTRYCLRTLSKYHLIQCVTEKWNYKFKINSDVSVLERLVSSEV